MDGGFQGEGINCIVADCPRPPGACYTVKSYRRAIERACIAAEIGI